MTLSIMTLSIMTLSIMTLSIMTLNIMTLSFVRLIVTAGNTKRKYPCTIDLLFDRFGTNRMTTTIFVLICKTD
jgi:hypothetical protein